jgi:hypothetical protein
MKDSPFATFATDLRSGQGNSLTPAARRCLNFPDWFTTQANSPGVPEALGVNLTQGHRVVAQSLHRASKDLTGCIEGFLRHVRTEGV